MTMMDDRSSFDWNEIVRVHWLSIHSLSVWSAGARARPFDHCVLIANLRYIVQTIDKNGTRILLSVLVGNACAAMLVEGMNG